MKANFALLFITLLSSATASVIGEPRNIARLDIEQSTQSEFWKRRGGGGGGGGRGGGSSGGSRGGSSSSGSSSGSRGGSSSSSSSSSKGNTASTSNSGGSSRGGSGIQPSYAGGRYYGGGATTPYRAGGRSPGGIAPYALGAGALAFWPGLWLYGAYLYPYHNPYYYHNASSGEDEQRNVTCGCGTYDVCGCDDNGNKTYLDQLIGNGSYAALNHSIVNIAEVNGSKTILINGSLPNGTTVASEDSPAAGLRSGLELLGFWPAVAAVLCAVYLS